jgi:antitoxin VapB
LETAKLFMSGRSQAVRLPKRFRFSGAEVAIRKEGDSVILSPLSRHAALEAFLAMPCFPDFSVERETVQQVQQKELF